MLISGSIREYVTGQMAKKEISKSKKESKSTFFMPMKLKSNETLVKRMDKDNKKSRLSYIASKLSSGKKLSSSELQFLKENNSNMYRKALKVQQERAELEKKLEACKTAKEVEDLDLSCDQESVSALDVHNAAKSNPSDALILSAALHDEYNKFIGSEKYITMMKQEPEGDKDEEKDR